MSKRVNRWDALVMGVAVLGMRGIMAVLLWCNSWLFVVFSGLVVVLVATMIYPYQEEQPRLAVSTLREAVMPVYG
jgi:uncharacterized membrane protein